MNPFESTRRTGKIARLPRELRHKINGLLYHGKTAVRIAEWLNSRPDVQNILKAEFAGRPINSQNLTEWKQGGYRDWLTHQELLNQIGDRAADAGEIAHAAKDMSDSLFALLTLDYAQAMKDREQQTPEEFEKKRESLGILSQDIVRLRRCHLHARRVKIQETNLDRTEEKTREQLLAKFVEWTQHPEIRKAFILAPMEHMRRLREIFNLPPKPEDSLIEKELQTAHSGPFQTNSGQKTKSPPASNQTSTLEKTTETPPTKTSEISNLKSEISASPPSCGKAAAGLPSTSAMGAHASRVPYSASSPNTSSSPKGCGTLAGDNIPGHARPASSHPEGMPESAIPPTCEKILPSNVNKNHPTAVPSPGGEGQDLPTEALAKVGEGELTSISSEIPTQNPKSKTQNCTNEFDRALAEGKTFLEALYIAQTPARTKPAVLVTRALDSFSESCRTPPCPNHHSTARLLPPKASTMARKSSAEYD
jgi:hypothetical protein